MSQPEFQVVGVAEVDLAVRDWLDRTVDAHVEVPTGDRRKVPVIFASGERFATGRSRKGVRDDNGVLILPLVSLRRTGVSRDPSMQALGAETATLQFARRLDPKTNDLKDLNLLRTVAQRVKDPVVFDVYTIPFPDRSVMSYELVVWAQYMTQVNAILEKLFNSLNIQNSFVAPLDSLGYRPPTGDAFEDRVPLARGYVVGFVDADLSDTGNFDEFTDQERVVRWTTTVRVPATLQLDPEGERPAVQVKRTSYRLTFTDESTTFVEDPADLDAFFGRGR